MHTDSLETRVSRLEGALGWKHVDSILTAKIFCISVILLLAAVYLSILGLGLPNHYYQVVLGIIFIALSYQRGYLLKPQKFYHWLLPVLNTAVISILLKLLLGAGVRAPFFWAHFPYMGIKSRAPEESWYKGMLPEFELKWAASELSTWTIDLTIVQTFLILAAFLAALADLQLFASLVAFLLLIVSLPALVSFEWSFVFPGIILAATAIYIQTQEKPLEKSYD